MIRPENEVQAQYERIKDLYAKESKIPTTTKTRILSLQLSAIHFAWTLCEDPPDWAYNQAPNVFS